MSVIDLIKSNNSEEPSPFLSEATTPAGKEIGKTLGNVFYFVFNRLNFSVEKLRIKQAESLDKFKEDIRNELTQIPEEKLIEPQLNLLGPALEASRFYIENDELRKMFSRLIAASMNKDTAENVQPSFVEIIKQLSPLDAANLEILANNNNKLPIASFHILHNNGGRTTFSQHVFLSNPNITDIVKQSTSISNLCRLGLIEIDYGRRLVDESRYHDFENHPAYLDLKNSLQKMNEEFENMHAVSTEIEKGIVRSTPFGELFMIICVGSYKESNT